MRHGAHLSGADFRGSKWSAVQTVNENSKFELKNDEKLSETSGVDLEVKVEAEVAEEQVGEFKIYDPRQDSNLSNSVNLHLYKVCPEVEIEDKVGVNSVNQ